MGTSQSHRPVLRIVATFSRYKAAFDWIMETASSAWGPIALASERFVFDQTTYYNTEMGADLRKQLLAFEQLADPGELPAWKHLSNRWELDYLATTDVAEARPLNVDPGYLTEAKLVLASTKDRDHRLYLHDGIFAEGTLYFHKGQWCTRPWTYPDYQTPQYHAFFDECRGYLRQQYRQQSGE